MTKRKPRLWVGYQGFTFYYDDSLLPEKLIEVTVRRRVELFWSHLQMKVWLRNRPFPVR